MALMEVAFRSKLPLSGDRSFLVLTEDKVVATSLNQTLREKGIPSIVGPPPLHSSPMGNKLGYRRGMFPVAEAMSDRALHLPCGYRLSKDYVKRVARETKRFFDTYLDY